MTAQQLKNSILHLAVQGKLVPQNPNDEPASVLLERIRAEKQSLVKEDKIKKDKPLPPIAAEEIPFDVPESWEWVKLGEIVAFLGGFAFKKNEYAMQSDNQIIRIGNVKNDLLQLDTSPVFISNDLAKLSTRYEICIGDILFTMTGTRGKSDYFYTCLVRQTDLGTRKLYLNQRVGCLRPFVSATEKLISCFLKSFCILEQIFSTATGTANQANIGSENTLNLIFPLPPLPEQHRIVERVEQLLPHIADYDTAEQKLTTLNAKFPEQLKKSILQSAVHGELVPQDENDEPASVLLECIRKEKEQLVKVGKIKKQKPLLPITDDEIPFDVPESWEWVRLGDIGDWGSGATPSRNNLDFYNGGTIPWLKTGDLNDGFISKVPEHITPLALEKTSVRLNPIGSVLIAMYGATIGKLGILSIEATTNQACCACVPISGILNKYLFYYLLSQRRNFKKQSEGGAQPNISKEKLIATLFPLPSLAEQYRIVAKCDELMAMVEGLSNFPESIV